MDGQYTFEIWTWIIVVAGYLLTLLLSGFVVRGIIGLGSPRQPEPEDNDTAHSVPMTEKRDVGAVIGKCENFLTVTLILFNEITGLALIFAAKSIVRAEDMRNDPRFYLGGTLVNFTFSVFMGFATRVALALAVPPGKSFFDYILS